MRLFFALGAFLISTALEAAPTNHIALPVARGLPGAGPWKIETWSDDGCQHCTIDQADLVAVRSFLKELTNNQPSSGNAPKLSVLIVGVGDSQGEQSSLAQLRKAANGCKVGSWGMLSPNRTTDLVAFGARLDCAAIQRSKYMSIVLNKEHAPAEVYWMPNGPIIVADTN